MNSLVLSTGVKYIEKITENSAFGITELYRFCSLGIIPYIHQSLPFCSALVMLFRWSRFGTRGPARSKLTKIGGMTHQN